jgi:hypothetical protein
LEISGFRRGLTAALSIGNANKSVISSRNPARSRHTVLPSGSSYWGRSWPAVNAPPAETRDPHRLPTAGVSTQTKHSVCTSAENNSQEAGRRQQVSPAAELHEIARQVRRIGLGWSESAEDIALAKERLAARLTGIALQLEGAP